MMLPNPPRRRWLPMLVLLLSVGAILYCISGYAMAASFSVAHPERHGYWARAAVWYLAVLGVSVVSLAVSGVVLWRGVFTPAPGESGTPSDRREA